ncbi:MAG: aldo/keto reductase, partial [Bacteroidales bacterium]|nr:aldo/keto reductase [Bacteroidales bacterium]
MKKNIDRRDFLKTAGSAALVMGGLGAVAGCKGSSASGMPEKAGNGTTEDGDMTYRTNSVNGDKVSILGYGCMRWPMIKDEEGKDIVDQANVDRLIDYAIEHGVNYFDTAPVYLQGQSEAATGLSLKRYPRDSYFIATKLSNFSNASKENSIEMYRNSLKNLQTEYIDYYLLHSLSGIEAFNYRFGDTGIMDFLAEERKAGRIRNLGFSFHGSTEGFDQLMALHEKYHWDFVQIQL